MYLIYGSRREDEILFRDELEAMTDVLDLSVVHVLEEPGVEWAGASGRVTPEVLERHLPDDPDGRFEYFVCGPPVMMDTVEPYLNRRGIPLGRVHSERFHIV